MLLFTRIKIIYNISLNEQHGAPRWTVKPLVVNFRNISRRRYFIFVRTYANTEVQLLADAYFDKCISIRTSFRWFKMTGGPEKHPKWVKYIIFESKDVKFSKNDFETLINKINLPTDRGSYEKSKTTIKIGSEMRISYNSVYFGSTIFGKDKKLKFRKLFLQK